MQNKKRMDQALDAYKQLAPSQEEQEALTAIMAVAAQYTKAISTSQAMHQSSNSPMDIDKTVKIDDSPAFKAFKILANNVRTLEDIAGFPGRIVKVKGKGKIISSPEFRQGSTLAHILIHFRKHGSAQGSLISLRNTEEIMKTIVSGKFIVRTKEADKNWDKTSASLGVDDNGNNIAKTTKELLNDFINENK